MSDPGPEAPDEPADAESTEGAEPGAESEWERRRRLAAVFGDVLPEQTSDDAPATNGLGDDWYRDQVPPHHG